MECYIFLLILNRWDSQSLYYICRSLHRSAEMAIRSKIISTGFSTYRFISNRRFESLLSSWWQDDSDHRLSSLCMYLKLGCEEQAKYLIWLLNEWTGRCTVLQDGQFAALSNNYWSLNFLQILMSFSTKNTNFVNFWQFF